MVDYSYIQSDLSSNECELLSGDSLLIIGLTWLTQTCKLYVISGSLPWVGLFYTNYQLHLRSLLGTHFPPNYSYSMHKYKHTSQYKHKPT